VLLPDEARSLAPRARSTLVGHDDRDRVRGIAARQQADESNLATLQSQQTDIQTALANLQTQIANNQAAQATENATLQSQITALQGIGSSTVIRNKSDSLTKTLTYAGLGLGVAGLGTGIGVILSDGDSGGDTPVNATPHDTPPDSSAANDNP